VKRIVGLGNPGEKYLNSRHNFGFMVANDFVKKAGIEWGFNQDWICYFAKSADFVIIKPKTFMNKSGEAARIASNFFKIEVEDILVIHDDLDFDFGKIRMALGGSSAGHNGVISVMESLGKPDFARLRIGIGSPRRVSDEAGRPENADPERYVLEDFTGEENKKLPAIIVRGCEAIKSFLDDGIEATMNKFN
jgi:PTH1 family peptidyl-tRNA hydrolase